MSKVNPLAGLIGNYDDTDDESDEGPSNAANGTSQASRTVVATSNSFATSITSAVHPAPIPHCSWSACYDESSGFTYYWNQQTNAVTWEAPPEYLLALKLAQQQLHTAGSTEVSAEEWQLYQQVLAEKQNSQNKAIAKTVNKPIKKHDKHISSKDKRKLNKKRGHSDDEEEKIELITSYHNSDSESDAESPVKAAPPLKPPSKHPPKNPHKKSKTKPQVEFGPTLPPNQNYSHPIGPEMPPELLKSPKPPINKETLPVKISYTTEDSQDENTLLKKLKDKTKLLEKLGGQIPSDLQQIIDDGPFNSGSHPISPTFHPGSPKPDVVKDIDNIDELFEEIEKKELPKIAKTKKLDIFDDTTANANGSAGHSPEGGSTPTVEPKPLFPCMNNISEAPCLFPSAANVQGDAPEKLKDDLSSLVAEKKGVNVYLMDVNEPIENTNRKKLRISNSVLPERKKSEVPSYTTKYANSIEGFATDRTGLGFSQDEEETEAPKNTVSYGKGLMFTKGETLNEDHKDDDLDELTDLVEAKLKYLSVLQPCVVTPVQEMLIQMQTLGGAFRAGALGGRYWRRWAQTAQAALAAHEASAAPPGWTCCFQRSEGRYRYRRESDGLLQWEYPAAVNMDMDICTTPPHPSSEDKQEAPPPPPPPPRVATPPPPSWPDPPPPGCTDLPPETKCNDDELLSFYNDIAQLEKHTSNPHTAPSSPEPPPLPPQPPEAKDYERPQDRDKDVDRDDKKDVAKSVKKSKVKISSSMGLKHKSVSNLVAKWQQVAEENESD